MRFDHLIHWVPDLDAAVAAYQAMGFPAVYGGHHPEFCTWNAATFLPPAYIEQLEVRDWDTFRDGYLEGRDDDARRVEIEGFQRFLAEGGGAGQFGVHVEDVRATVERLRQQGVAASNPSVGSIEMRDGSTGSWTGADVIEVPAWRPFFICYHGSSRERPPPQPWQFGRLIIETEDPEVELAWLALVLALPTEPDVGILRLPGCTLQLIAGPANRVTTVVLSGADVPVGEVARLHFEGSARP